MPYHYGPISRLQLTPTVGLNGDKKKIGLVCAPLWRKLGCHLDRPSQPLIRRWMRRRRLLAAEPPPGSSSPNVKSLDAVSFEESERDMAFGQISS
jgi:hypothetical protein